MGGQSSGNYIETVMSNKLKFFLLILSAGLFFLRKSSLALAQGYQLQVPLPGVSGTVSGPSQYIRAIFTFGLSIVGIAALLAIVIGGFKYLRSGGSETRKTSCKEWIWGAVIGLVLMLCSWLILNTINPKLTSLSEPKLQTIDLPENVAALSPYTPGGTPSPSGPIPGQEIPANTVASKANELSGKLSYCYGGDPTSGCTDCSGSAERLRMELGGSDPGRSSVAQLAEAKASGNFSTELNSLQPGDIIIRTSYSGGNHVGTYVGDNLVWDSTKSGWQMENINNFMSRGQLLGINQYH